MNIYILIITVASSGQVNAGVSTISAEFNSLQTCMVAQKHILEHTSDRGQVRVLNKGCYQK